MARLVPSFGFTSVTISFFIHSTEDVSTLVSLVSERLKIDESDFEVRQLEGHYGNSLHYAAARITGNGANAISKLIFSQLDEQSRKSIMITLDSSLDEHDALYIRLDRQLLHRLLTIGTEEPIRIKFKPSNRRGGRETIRRQYLELLRA